MGVGDGLGVGVGTGVGVGLGVDVALGVGVAVVQVMVIWPLLLLVNWPGIPAVVEPLVTEGATKPLPPPAPGAAIAAGGV